MSLFLTFPSTPTVSPEPALRPPGGHAHRGRSNGDHAGTGQLARRDSKSHHCVSASAVGLALPPAEDPVDRVSKVTLPLWPFCTRLSCPVPRVCHASLAPSDWRPAAGGGAWAMQLCATATGRPPARRHEGVGLGRLSFPLDANDKRASTQWETSGNAVVGACLPAPVLRHSRETKR